MRLQCANKKLPAPVSTDAVVAELREHHGSPSYSSYGARLRIRAVVELVDTSKSWVVRIRAKLEFAQARVKLLICGLSPIQLEDNIIFSLAKSPSPSRMFQERAFAFSPRLASAQL